jgi:aminoglycoside 3-N-acetyltransferase
MKSITPAEILAAFHKLGLQAGDYLLVHSAIQYLGRPEGGVGIYFNALCEILNIPSPLYSLPSTSLSSLKGTLAVPAFNFAFARGEPYDPQNTPSTGMGVFSEYVRLQPGVRRTSHPMQSLAVIGSAAQDIASLDTPGAFDDGSAFERLLQLDCKILLLGADIDAISMLHYSEQRARVPYRYWKEFRGLVNTSTGWQERTYRMYVRDLDLDPRLTLKPVKDMLENQGQLKSMPLNYGTISVLKARDFVAAVDACLARDPWALVTNRPSFLPFD